MDQLKRILVVDDERQNIKVLVQFLGKDYKIMAAKDGETALKALNKGPLPDLILLDIMMPGMNGYEVIKKIKSEDRTKRIPVIFITALDATGDETQGFELGAVDYIKKPFKPVIVKARVKTHIELKHNADLLDRLASLDGLTQIPNRRSFDTLLEKEMRILPRKPSYLSMVMMDIDHFKNYNDRYGHTAGDACLKKVALALENVTSRAGDFVARYGGEEFAMILVETDLYGAVHVAKEAQQAVKDLAIEHAASNVSEIITMSMGVAATSSDQGLDPVEFIKKADSALYQAKSQGRDCVVTAP